MDRLPASASAPSLSSNSKGNAISTSPAAVIGEKKSSSIAEPTAPKSIEPPTKHPKLTSSASGSLFNCGNCIGCFRKEDCGRCDVCKSENDGDQVCLLRRCVNAESSLMAGGKTLRSESDDDEPYVERKKRTLATPRTNVKNVNRKDGSGEKRMGRPPKNKSATSSPSSATTANSGGTRASARAYRNFLKDAGVLPNSDDESGRGQAKPRQCYGPGCIYAARPQSKYCSDECGLKLAQLRIQHLLPSRIQQFYARRPAAEEYEQRRLDRIRAEHTTGQTRLAELDIEERELHAWREKCKTVRLKENDGGKGAKSKMKMVESDDPETSVYCVTCGNETSMKNAIKHFAKCFSKYESQTSYGSSFKAVNNLYNIFCDTYNKANRTYCKRLRVICPEHSKEGKVEAHEVCGCPLCPDKNLKLVDFDISTLCTTLKKNCTKHYRWLQIRRALIDMERLTQLLRMEELAEESRCIQVAQNSRGSLLALLLHQTISHEESLVKSEEGKEKEEKGEQENVKEEAGGASKAEDVRAIAADHEKEMKKVDAVPKYPEEGMAQKLEDGWQGVYGD